MYLFKNNLSIFILLIIILFPSIIYSEENISEPEQIRAKVLKILDTTNEEYEGIVITTTQYLEVEIKSGKYKGEIIEVTNSVDPSFAYSFHVHTGNNIFINIIENENGEIIDSYVVDYVRDKYLLYLAIVFALVLISIGMFKGVKSIITLIITGILIVKVMLPYILKGVSPIFLSIIIGCIITVFSFILISGFNKKTFSAILGTLGGVVIAGFISSIVSLFANLSGLGMDEAQMLLSLPMGQDLNLKGILFASILIGSLGAVMDVSMSIASSIYEVSTTRQDIDTKSLFKSGMNVGRDVMGTMSNTLILAYTGSSLPLMLAILGNNISMIKIINLDMIATEVVRALSGSIGLFIAIPLTSIIASKMYTKEI